MKKIFLAIVLSTLPALVLAAQTPVTTIDKFNSSTTSINNLREATNTKLGVIESNRQDHVTNIAGKADKSATVMLWSAWADGVSFTTTSPPVAYNGAIYKCVAPYTKVAGETPDTQTDYFAEVTGSGGTGDACVRVNGAANTGYCVKHESETVLKVVKIVNGTEISLQSYAQSTSSGDTISISAVGTTLTAFKNGTTLSPTVSNGDIASGQPGVYIWSGIVRLDDFSAEEL